MTLPPRYTSRPAEQTDLDAVVQLVKACDRADVGLEDPVREIIESDWQRPGYDLARDSALALADDGSIAGYADLFGYNPELSVDVWVRVHPEHRGRGLGSALLSWAEERAQRTVPGHAAAKLFNAVPMTDEAARTFLARRGYAQVRVFWHMERDLHGGVEPAVPSEGVAIVAYRHGRDADAVYEVLEEAFADHWGFEPHPRDAVVEELGRTDPGLIWLARGGGATIGAVVSRLVEGTGYVNDLGVRRPWRGRGIGRALLLRAFAGLAERGATSVTLNVDSTNETGATRLYESVGMHVRRAWDVYERTIGAAVS